MAIGWPFLWVIATSIKMLINKSICNVIQVLVGLDHYFFSIWPKRSDFNHGCLGLNNCPYCYTFRLSCCEVVISVHSLFNLLILLPIISYRYAWRFDRTNDWLIGFRFHFNNLSTVHVCVYAIFFCGVVSLLSSFMTHQGKQCAYYPKPVCNYYPDMQLFAW